MSTGETRVTVCIAAVCETGQKIIVAADRMFTAAAPINFEFETAEQKIEEVATTCVSLFSGNSGIGTEILSLARMKLAGSQTRPIAEVVSIVKDSYISVRAQKTTESIVNATLGGDFLTFLTKGGILPVYLQTQPAIYGQLVVQMNQFNLGLDTVIAGIDTTGAHIYRVAHPGAFYCLDKLGYDAIGSGGIHALTRLYMSRQVRSKSFLDTLYTVYDAKRAAEVAPGVGEATDIAIIDQAAIKRCPDKVLDELRKSREEAVKTSAPNLDAVKAALDS